MKKLVIVGNGGFAREVEWLVERINEKEPTWEFLGFINNSKDSEKVIGDDQFICNYDSELFVSIAIGTSEIRHKLYDLYKKNSNIRFPNLIDPSVLYSNSINIGEGNIICAGTIITVDISIGNFNIINLDCTVGHDCMIGDFVTVNPSVNLSGNAVIGSQTNIGTGTQVLQGVKIGSSAVIGAGAVVNREIPDRCTAVGVPAKVIKYFETEEKSV